MRYAFKCINHPIKNNQLYLICNTVVENNYFRSTLYERYKHKCISYDNILYQHRYLFHFKKQYSKDLFNKRMSNVILPDTY